VSKKCTAKPTEGESIPKYKKKILYEHRPSAARFSSFSLLMIKDVQSVHLEFPYRHVRGQTSGAVLSSTTSDWGCLSQFPKKHPSRAVARCGSAD
jgi:hypothetical protein